MTITVEEHPCPNATLYEINRAEHYTSNVEECDTCLLILSIFEKRRELAEIADELI